VQNSLALPLCSTAIITDTANPFANLTRSDRRTPGGGEAGHGA
jgi:hypothetical protein